MLDFSVIWVLSCSFSAFLSSHHQNQKLHNQDQDLTFTLPLAMPCLQGTITLTLFGCVPRAVAGSCL
jgi:small neutral amino acid transporter SnatA (MarC family)